MKPHTTTANQPQVESQIFQKPDPAQLAGSDTILAHHAKHFFTREERSNFYAGQDRLTLQSGNLDRVRELQEANDGLQRQVATCEKDLKNTTDPLALLAEIEHCYIMIARNTGEILNVYSMNEARLRRIAELEAQNLELHQNMSDSQGQFISTRDMTMRTQHAAEFFLNKATYERNIEELRSLSQG